MTTNEISWPTLEALEAALWREAQLASDVDGFLARVGGRILEALAVPSVMVLVLDREQRRLDTVAAIGIAPRPRSELGESRGHRTAAWIDAGRPARGSSVVARDLGVPDDGNWLLVPVAPSGVVVLGQAGHVDEHALSRVLEPIATVLAGAPPRRVPMRDIEEAIVGAEAGLRDVMRAVEQVAATRTPVLLFGETGSGKEVVARAIHDRSPRANGPVLRVNCGAIAPELIDSELFGHERGSFTGASAQRAGWFERADGGTLFLDEIAELPLAAQVRLLRVLQDGVFERVGGTRPLQVDARVVAATHRDLAAMVRAGQFREDLWYRINVFTIRLPALRERIADIPALAAHFVDRTAQRFGTAQLALTASDILLLQQHDWPGNVRELSAVIERAAILGEGRRLDIARALGVRAPAPASSGIDFPSLDDAIRLHIERALRQCQGRIEGTTGAAKLLRVHPNTLRSRMQKLGVRWEQYRC